MRKLATILMALTLVAAACGDDSGGLFTTATSPPVTTSSGDGSTTTTVPPGLVDEYPEEIVEAYMGGCTPESGAGFCQCSIDEFQLRLTLGEFLNLDADALEDNPVAMEVVDICLFLIDPGPNAGSTTTIPEFTPITNIEDIIDISIIDLEEYWAEELPNVFGVVYESPALVAPYFISQGDVPECGAGNPCARYGEQCGKRENRTECTKSPGHVGPP